MNRRDFIASIAVGLVITPSAVRSISLPPRTCLEWLDDVRKECPTLTVIVSPDAVEYFRAKYGSKSVHPFGMEAPVNGGTALFYIETRPYRYHGGKIVSPYLSLDEQSKLNPAWLNAEVELLIAYGESFVHFAPYYRKTFTLTGPEYTK